MVRYKERQKVQMPLAKWLRGNNDPCDLEVSAAGGRADIVTDSELIECKLKINRGTFYSALGQLSTYSTDLTGRQFAIAVNELPTKKVFELASKNNVKIYVVNGDVIEVTSKHFQDSGKSQNELSPLRQISMTEARQKWRKAFDSIQKEKSKMMANNLIEPWSGCPLSELEELRDELVPFRYQYDFYAAFDCDGAVLDYLSWEVGKDKPLKLPKHEIKRLSSESRRNKLFNFNFAYISIHRCRLLPQIREWHKTNYPSSEGFINTWEPRLFRDAEKVYSDWPKNPNYGRKITDLSVIKACAIASTILLLDEDYFYEKLAQQELDEEERAYKSYNKHIQGAA